MKIKKQNSYVILICLSFTEAGTSFGEIALISDNCVRNASIIADEESDLLVIHRDLFNTYIKVMRSSILHNIVVN